MVSVRVAPKVSALALVVAAGWSMPALAQEDTAAIRAELAEMRARMAEMGERIETLEAALDAAQPQQSAVTQATTAPTQAAAPAAVVPAEARTEITWKGAPELEAPGGWSFKPRGRLNYDAGYVSAPDETLQPDGFGSEARRIRLGVEGDIPGGFGYKLELDFAANRVEVTDAILSYKDGPLTIAIGQQNTFQGLEELTSSRFSSFIERAGFTDAFGFERRAGLSAQYAKGDVLLQAGIFTDNMNELPNQAWSLDGRVVYMPKLGSTQLHLGGSLHYRELDRFNSVFRYRQRPLVHFFGSRFIDTGQYAAEGESGLGLEFAAINGPFHAAAEVFWQRDDRLPTIEDPTFFGGYAEVGYYLTGESRGYKKGVFNRTRPNSPIGEGGPGAWQVNLRYDRLDLNDADVLGGTQDGYQASIVWIPTDYTRLLINYGRLEYNDAAIPAAQGDRSFGVDVVAMRAQIDF